uniref:Uncharacterized protein n=2 Tax=Pyxicephalus adspersus TaxID=30357 RepID=A0AAV3B2Z4_PYXAD|nr:TPA: hypothetical protein GDO54_002037 [Pyxicephalus adspersus]
MRKKILPKMLKSLPRSESIYSGGNDCTSPSYTVPVEIVSQKLELEVNKSQGNEDKIQEGGYASRKKLLDSDTSAGDSSGPILSTNSSSLESSDQTTESSGEERIITEHPTSLDIITDSGGSFPSIPTNDFKATSDLPFSNSGVFNIDLNSICIANSVDTWTGLKNEDSLKEEPEKKTDTTSEQTGLSLNGDNFLCAPNVLVDLKPTTIEYGSDNYEEELSDYGDFCDSDDHIVSGYMRR